MRFLLVHDNTGKPDSMKSFFTEIYELFVKVSYKVNTYLYSTVYTLYELLTEITFCELCVHVCWKLLGNQQ